MSEHVGGVRELCQKMSEICVTDVRELCGRCQTCVQDIRGLCGRCQTAVWKVLSPFLIGRMFVREPNWKYSANLVGS